MTKEDVILIHRLDESEMLRNPGEIYQTGNRFFEVDVWSVLHPIK